MCKRWPIIGFRPMGRGIGRPDTLGKQRVVRAPLSSCTPPLSLLLCSAAEQPLPWTKFCRSKGVAMDKNLEKAIQAPLQITNGWNSGAVNCPVDADLLGAENADVNCCCLFDNHWGWVIKVSDMEKWRGLEFLALLSSHNSREDMCFTYMIVL